MKIKQAIIKIGLSIIIGTSNYVYADEASMTVTVTNSTSCQVTCTDGSCMNIKDPQKVTGVPVYSFYKNTFDGPKIMDKMLQVGVTDNIKYTTYSSQSSFSVVLSKYDTGAAPSEFANNDPLYYNNTNIIQYIVYPQDKPGLLLWWAGNPCATLEQ